MEESRRGMNVGLEGGGGILADYWDGMNDRMKYSARKQGAAE